MLLSVDFSALQLHNFSAIPHRNQYPTLMNLQTNLILSDVINNQYFFHNFQLQFALLKLDDPMGHEMNVANSAEGGVYRNDCFHGYST